MILTYKKWPIEDRYLKSGKIIVANWQRSSSTFFRCVTRILFMKLRNLTLNSKRN